MTMPTETLVISEPQAARMLGLTTEGFRKARLAGLLPVKPLPLMRRKQRLYFKEALLLWLQRESGLVSPAESTDDWDEIVRQRLGKGDQNGKV
jgi:hypothetical protein